MEDANNPLKPPIIQTVQHTDPYMPDRVALVFDSREHYELWLRAEHSKQYNLGFERGKRDGLTQFQAEARSLVNQLFGKEVL